MANGQYSLVFLSNADLIRRIDLVYWNGKKANSDSRGTLNKHYGRHCFLLDQNKVILALKPGQSQWEIEVRAAGALQLSEVARGNAGHIHGAECNPLAN